MKIRKLAHRACLLVASVAALPRCASDPNSSESHFFECSPAVPCEAGLVCEAGHCVSPDGGDRLDGGRDSSTSAGPESGAGGSTAPDAKSSGGDGAEAGGTGGSTARDAGASEAGGAEAGAPRDSGNGGNANLFGPDGDPPIGRCPGVGDVTEFALPRPDGGHAYPRGLVVGPDGNVWFSVAVMGVANSGAEVVRVTPSGDMTEFPVPSAGYLTVGSDGNLWIAGASSVFRVTVTGVVTEFPVPQTAPGYRGISLVGITSGPDGALWFTEYDDNQIGRITTDGTLTEFTLPYPVQTVPEDPKVVGAYGITAGPDGNLWFTENETSGVGRITPNGVVTEFPLLPFTYSRHPVDIQSQGGSLVVVENYSADVLMRVSTDGVVTPMFSGPLPSANSLLAAGLAFTADGSTWVGGYGNIIARVTPSGDVSTCDPSGGTAIVQPFAVATSPSGDVWFIEASNDAVGFIRPKPL
jgi:streptogramin lyase